MEPVWCREEKTGPSKGLGIGVTTSGKAVLRPKVPRRWVAAYSTQKKPPSEGGYKSDLLPEAES